MVAHCRVALCLHLIGCIQISSLVLSCHPTSREVYFSFPFFSQSSSFFFLRVCTTRRHTTLRPKARDPFSRNPLEKILILLIKMTLVSLLIKQLFSGRLSVLCPLLANVDVLYRCCWGRKPHLLGRRKEADTRQHTTPLRACCI